MKDAIAGGLGLLLIAVLATPCAAQLPPSAAVAESASFRPERRDATDERIGQLQVAAGFRLNVFARDQGHARIMVVDSDGTVYLTCPRQNRVMALKDTNQDGQADQIAPAFENLPMVHGITIHRDTMYLAAPTILWTAKRQPDGKWDAPAVAIRDLPDGGQHPNRTLAVGPDEMLYISVGSTCNACEESNPEHATILRANLDGTGRTVFARGLRNTIGFDWHPQTRQMWGMDHGSDGRGNDLPPEELNLLQEGRHYGWPWAFGKRQVDPQMGDPGDGPSKQELAQKSEPSVLEYQAHSAPIEFKFYRGEMFPEPWRSGAFTAMRGSWNRFPATGYKLLFVRYENGRPTAFEDFVTGFLIENGKAQFGRLAGVAFLPDGSLIFSDDENGMIYRVSRQGV